MSEFNKRVIRTTSSLSGLSEEIVEGILKVYRLALLSELYQESVKGEVDVLEDEMILVNLEDPLHPDIEVSDTMYSMIYKSVVNGVDYLGSEVSEKFEERLVKLATQSSIVLDFDLDDKEMISDE